MGGLLGGKGYVAPPPLKLLGACPPPCTPLFLRLCSVCNVIENLAEHLALVRSPIKIVLSIFEVSRPRQLRFIAYMTPKCSGRTGEWHIRLHRIVITIKSNHLLTDSLITCIFPQRISDTCNVNLFVNLVKIEFLIYPRFFS